MSEWKDVALLSELGGHSQDPAYNLSEDRDLLRADLFILSEFSSMGLVHYKY